MKPNTGKYQNVKILPKNAMTVREYAESQGYTTSYVYKLLREGKAQFKIVTFQTINFIIP
mgnify:CR=1 FL=1